QRTCPGASTRRARARGLDILTRDQIEARRGAARDVGDLVRTFPSLLVSEIHYPGSGAIKEICIVDRSAIRGGALTVRPPGGRPASGDGTERLKLGQQQINACQGAAVALDEVLIGGNAGE